MKNTSIIIFVLLATLIQAQNTKSILLEQLKSTHNVKNWFVPVNVAVEGLSAEQAGWKDKGNHSVGQLAYHLMFWNERSLQDFKRSEERRVGKECRL